MASERLQKSISTVLIVLLGASSTPLGCSASDDYARAPHQATHDGATSSPLPTLPEAPEETVQQIRDCVKQHASSSAGDFVIDLRADVTRDGQAQTARIVSSNLRDADLEQCILQAVTRMRVSPEILDSSSTEPLSRSPQSRSTMGIAIPNPAIVLAGFMVIYGISVMIQITLQVVLSSPSAPTIPAPIAATTTTTTPTATTTTTAPPIVLPRKPGQTCDDKRLNELEKAKKAVCAPARPFPGQSCTPPENDVTLLPEYPCSVIRARIAAIKVCIAARQQVMDECFKNATDAAARGHAEQIQNLINGVTWCQALEAVNCAPRHPMSRL